MTVRLPEPGATRIDPLADAHRVWDVLKAGGIAIVANDVGYGIWAGSPEGAQRVYEAKRRGGHKRHAITVGRLGQRELHVLEPRKRDMIACLTEDYDLPIGVVAPYDSDNPYLRAIDPGFLSTCTANGTVGTLLNGGIIHEEVGRLAYEEHRPVFGSSANLTGSGTRFRLEDVQPEIRALADIEIDYGLRPYHVYQRSSTGINFATMEVLRIGAAYELIADVLKRHFDVDLPADPGREVNPSGHLQEFALEDWEAAGR